MFTEPEGSQTPSDLDEPEEEEEEEYVPPVVQRSPVVTQRTPVAPPRRRGSQELDDDEFLNSLEGKTGFWLPPTITELKPGLHAKFK